MTPSNTDFLKILLVLSRYFVLFFCFKKETEFFQEKQF